MFNKIKEKFAEFDPRLKKLVMMAIVITIIAIFVFGGENPAEEITQEEAKKEIAEIESEYKSGSISRSVARSRSSGVKSKTENSVEIMKKKYSNVGDYNGLPDWARKAGIPEISSLTLVPEKSLIITPDKVHLNSFAAVYSGSSESLISESKKIADRLDLNIISDMSYSFAAKGGVGKYSVSISVSSNTDGYQLKYGASE